MGCCSNKDDSCSSEEGKKCAEGCTCDKCKACAEKCAEKSTEDKGDCGCC